MQDVLIYNVRLVDEHTDTEGALLVRDGRIFKTFSGPVKKHAQVLQIIDKDDDVQLYDGRGLVLMPAFIDMHVHFRYPGQTEKEDLNTGLHAAVAGGYGTVVAMPNTKPVVSAIEQVLSIDREAAAYGLAALYQTCSLTAGFSGTDVSHLEKLDAERVPVITEDGRDVPSPVTMLEVMRKAARKGIIVSCHSEDTALAAAARPWREKALALMKTYHIPAWGAAVDTARIPQAMLSSINESLAEANRLLALAEDIATERNLALAAAAGCRVHIAHVSTRRSLEAVCRARQERGAEFVSCEVTPHHFALDGMEPPLLYALVNPPLRSSADREFLVKGLCSGAADVISTDHAPHTAADKAAGAPGFTGIETAFAVSNTVLVKSADDVPGPADLKVLSRCMSAAPARILRLRKGLLQEGYDADLVLVNPDERWTVDSAQFVSKGKATPFNGKKVRGKVHVTFIGGKTVYIAP